MAPETVSVLEGVGGRGPGKGGSCEAPPGPVQDPALGA